MQSPQPQWNKLVLKEAPKKVQKKVTPVPTVGDSNVRAAVEAEFGQNSIMVRIAGCESKFRQFDSSGAVLRGVANPLDRGVFQINEHYHLATSKKMGIDILTLSGNIKYARYLYDTQGTTPWNWSKPCWG